MRKQLISLGTAILCSTLVVNAQQPPSPDGFEFKPGQSVYVIVVKTSSPVASPIRDKVSPNIIWIKNGQMARIGNSHIDQRPITPDRPTLERSLPEPLTLERSVSAPDTLTSTDPLLKAKIEEEFKKQKKFKLAASADSADFVFFAFSSYPNSILAVGGSGIIHAWRGYDDSPYTSEAVKVLSFALPTSAYRQIRKDVVELSDAAQWQGYANSITLPAFIKGNPAQQGAAKVLVGKFHEEVLKKKKSQRSPSPPQLPQAEAGKNRSPVKTLSETLAPTPPASQDEATVKLETALVVVPVTVLDREGLSVPNLTPRDFHVFEDNVEQEIDHFSSVEAPFNVVLLLDTSSSVRLKVEDIQSAALAFMEKLRPQDRVMAVSFNSEVYLDAEFTSDHAQLRHTIYAPRSRAGTRLYDAVDLVLTERLKQVEGRKAIVLFTDGVDTESRLATAPSTLELAEESDVLIYTIRYNTADDVVENPLPVTINGQMVDIRTQRSNASYTGTEAYRAASQYLRELSERTGAHLYQAETINNLSQAFALIAGDLRQQYALSYYPSNAARDGSYRRIRIRVDRPDVVVRARPGYRAAQETPARDQNTQRPAVKRSQP